MVFMSGAQELLLASQQSSSCQVKGQQFRTSQQFTGHFSHHYQFISKIRCLFNLVPIAGDVRFLIVRRVTLLLVHYKLRLLLFFAHSGYHIMQTNRGFMQRSLYVITITPARLCNASLSAWVVKSMIDTGSPLHDCAVAWLTCYIYRSSLAVLITVDELVGLCGTQLMVATQ